MSKQEMPVKPEVQKPELKKTKSPRKPNTTIIVALIGFVGTIIAALIGSPIIERWFSNAPFSTESATATITMTSQVVPSKTIEPRQTPSEVIALSSTPARVSTATPVLGIGATMVAEKDRMVMVYVPAGNFTMGADDTTRGYDINRMPGVQPIHDVYLDSFWIDTTEVTNTMYLICVDDNVCKDNGSPRLRNSSYATHPVTWVSWEQAKMYCEWADRRLPTEAEWEKAARGTDGRSHPWGNDSQPSCSYLNRGNCFRDTVPVGSYPIGASPYGALDMVGNVWEWVSDWYDEAYYSISPIENPTGPTIGEFRVVRGYSWGADYFVDFGNTFGRYFRTDDYFNYDVGFRCANDANP